ncbi:peptidoglycan-binding domain-containing protein [Fimbriimonas ginsengisoli]|uniref:peptidoglycan-binding domain-containing protein n=1 Tax=Fimbriimonas ginsengisoli TaxID=1005039 RepID=UPI00046CAD71|nr:peptidoglycan-binding domain-containing protein [Fimbriimonas ginsengisoli]
MGTALAEKHIRIESNKVTVSEIRSMAADPRTGSKERIGLTSLLRAYESRSAFEKLMFEQRLARINDFSHISVVNLTPYPAVLAVHEPAAFGTQPETTYRSEVSRLGIGVSNLVVWKKNTEDLQGSLRALGFYKGGIDGKDGPATRSATKRYQKSRKLEPSGMADAQTLESIKSDTLSADVRAVQAHLGANRELLFLERTSDPSRERFTVILPSGERTLPSESVSSAVRSAIHARSGKGVDEFVIVGEDLTDRQADAVEAAVGGDGGLPPNTRVRVMSGGMDDHGRIDVSFFREQHKVIAVSDPVAVMRGKRRGWFQANVELRNRFKRAREMKIVTRTRDLANAYVTSFRNLIALNDYSDILSLIAGVKANAQRTVKHRAGEARIEFKGRRWFVRLERKGAAARNVC